MAKAFDEDSFDSVDGVIAAVASHSIHLQYCHRHYKTTILDSSNCFDNDSMAAWIACCIAFVNYDNSCYSNDLNGLIRDHCDYCCHSIQRTVVARSMHYLYAIYCAEY